MSPPTTAAEPMSPIDPEAMAALLDKELAATCLTFNTTDIGNGERFALRYSVETKYVAPRKTWLIWDGARWKADEVGIIREYAKAAARAINAEIAIAPDDRIRDLRQWAKYSEHEARLSAMLKMAASDASIVVVPNQLDANPDLINLENGTFNLRTLEIQPHNRDDLITKVARVAYDPGARCPLWLDHLALIFGEDQSMIDGLQEFLGYTLLSGNPLQIFVLWWGEGENGKSVTLAVIRHIFGEYHHHADAEVFMDTNRDGTSPRPEILAMRGARLVTSSESKKGRTLDAAMIKAHSGGEPINVRGLYTANEVFDPEYTPVLLTNHNPRITDTTHAMWRRLMRWPFTVQIPDDKKVIGYEALLIEEAPGVFAWMVEGLRRFYANGYRLTIPEKCQESTRAYRESQDKLAPFIVERCEIDPKARTKRTDLSVEWFNWCRDGGDEEPGTAGEFYKLLEEHGWAQSRTGAMGWRFWGIRLKTPKERDEYEAERARREAAGDTTSQGRLKTGAGGSP